MLQQIGLPFTVVPSQVDENSQSSSGLSPARLVEQLALAKAREVANRAAGPDQVVIGADTVVVLDDVVLGKPTDADEARSMLRRLAGRSHEVYTGVALVDGTGRAVTDHVRTRVWMREFPAHWIEAYVATGEPMDKAGAYAVQGLGSIFIERIEGCYFNVVGLPLPALVRMLEDWGIDVPSLWSSRAHGRSATRPAGDWGP